MNRPLKTLATSLITAATVAAAGVAAAAPASAADAAQFCFVYTNGAPYSSGRVVLYAASGQKLREGRSAANGCGTFTGLNRSTSYYVRAYQALGDANVGIAIYDGYSRYSTGTGAGTVSLGTGANAGTVRLVSCTPGLYSRIC